MHISIYLKVMSRKYICKRDSRMSRSNMSSRAIGSSSLSCPTILEITPYCKWWHYSILWIELKQGSCMRTNRCCYWDFQFQLLSFRITWIVIFEKHWQKFKNWGSANYYIIEAELKHIFFKINKCWNQNRK